MKLTAKQEAYLSRFLRDINLHLGAEVSGTLRETGLRGVQRDIYRRLEAAANEEDALSDEVLFQVLRGQGKPEAIAARLIASAPATPSTPTTTPRPTPKPAMTSTATSPDTTPQDDDPHRVWLGVCVWVAEFLDQDPRLIRLVVFLVGVITGPFALFAYLGGGFYLHATGQIRLSPKPEPIPLLGRVAGYNAIILLLHVGMAFFLRFVYAVYESFLQQLPPELTAWGWLEAWRGALLFWMLAFGIPLSLLGGLPLAHGWDHSLRRFLQAMIALYAVILCFGIASILVGLLLGSVEDIRILIG